ncbi:MAG: hypothetical protein HEQ35_18505 [Gloeotrichia echinulata IR180]|jgi:hypothetical protein|nr:hypothetical protein [Gloeotrichia echinulata DEX184]
MLAKNLENLDSPDFVALNKDGQVILIAEIRGFPFKLEEPKAKTHIHLHLYGYQCQAFVL